MISLAGIVGVIYSTVKLAQAESEIQLIVSRNVTSSADYLTQLLSKKTIDVQAFGARSAKGNWTAAIVGSIVIVGAGITYLVVPSESQDAKEILQKMLDAMIYRQPVHFKDSEIAQARVVLEEVLR